MATIVAHHDHCAIVEQGPSAEHVAQASDGNGGEMEMMVYTATPCTCKGIFLEVTHAEVFAIFDGQRWVGQLKSEADSPP